MRISKFYLITALTSAGCQRAVTPTTPEAPSPATSPAASPVFRSGRTSWTITPSIEPTSYRSVITSTLESVAAGQSARDSLLSTVDYILSINRESAAAVSFSATVQSIQVQGGPRTGASSQPLQIPVLLRGRFDKTQSTITFGDQPLDCSSSSTPSAIPIIQRAVILLPQQIIQGMTWTDSTTSAVCSGGIPASLTAVRTYRVLGEANSAIVLERQEKTTSKGEGSEGEHRIQIRSLGSGKAELRIHAETGALLSSTGTHTAVVTVTASGRDQQITQVSREEVTRR